MREFLCTFPGPEHKERAQELLSEEERNILSFQHNSHCRTFKGVRTRNLVVAKAIAWKEALERDLQEAESFLASPPEDLADLSACCLKDLEQWSRLIVEETPQALAKADAKIEKASTGSPCAVLREEIE